MPYIQREIRWQLDIEDHQLDTSGQLNFFITQLVSAYIRNHGLSYESINSVMGVLECAKLEAYRRVAVPYENDKIKANGDVYPTSQTTEREQ